jgi:hypothetical protein
VLSAELLFALTLNIQTFTGMELSKALAAVSCWVFTLAPESLVLVLVVHVWLQFIEKKRRARRS